MMSLVTRTTLVSFAPVVGYPSTTAYKSTPKNTTPDVGLTFVKGDKVKLEVGRRYLATDSKGQPTVYFVCKHIKQMRLWYKMLRDGLITVSPA
jgi:hypothetical protein